jgi:hypothetical protein
LKLFTENKNPKALDFFIIFLCLKCGQPKSFFFLSLSSTFFLLSQHSGIERMEKQSLRTRISKLKITRIKGVRNSNNMFETL